MEISVFASPEKLKYGVAFQVQNTYRYSNNVVFIAG